MSLRLGVAADPAGPAVTALLEDAGWAGLVTQAGDDLARLRALIAPDLSCLDAERVEAYVHAGGALWAGTRGAGPLPFGVQAVEVAAQGDVLFVRDAATGLPRGLRLPLWRLPVSALSVRGTGVHELARAAEGGGPAVVSARFGAGRVVLFGFDVIEAIERSRRRQPPYAFGAWSALLRATMLDLLAEGTSATIEPWPEGHRGAVVFSFDMERPIANRAIGRVLVRSPRRRGGRGLVVSLHRTPRVLPGRRGVVVTRARSVSTEGEVRPLRVSAALASGRRVFRPRAVWTLQVERSTGKHVVEAALGSFVEDLLRVAESFRAAGCRCTLFVPGRLVEAPAVAATLRALAADGFEIAAHGYAHDHYGPISRRAIARDVRRALAAFADAGLEPAGYRCPGLSHTGALPEILGAAGLQYDSSFTEPYPSYPLVVVAAGDDDRMRHVPISANLFVGGARRDTALAATGQGALVHLYGHDHELRELGADDLMRALEHTDGSWVATALDVARWDRRRATCRLRDVVRDPASGEVRLEADVVAGATVRVRPPAGRRAHALAHEGWRVQPGPDGAVDLVALRDRTALSARLATG